METNLITAIIAAGTSIITTTIFKPFWDKHLIKFQLKQNYIANQSKKAKEHIALHKSPLLKSAELLNQRLKNFAKNHNKGWLNIAGNYSSNSHYIDTTVYRFLSFFAQIKIIEKDLIYIDTTIAQKNDIRMLKYFRVFNEVMCDVDLFEGLQYDMNYQTDHFFTSPFLNLTNLMIESNRVIELEDFLKLKISSLEKIEIVYQFFDSLSPTENRLRCERLKALHILLIAFLNEYGYDYQKTPKEKFNSLKSQLGEYKLLKNLETLISKFKLNRLFNDPIKNIITEFM